MMHTFELKLKTNFPKTKILEEGIAVDFIDELSRNRYYSFLNPIGCHFESKPLQEITRQDYQMFINEFGSNKAKETVEKVNTHIHACVKDAIDEQIIHRDFTRNAVITYTVPAKKTDEKHLNYKESQLLLNEIWKRLDQGLGYSLLLLGFDIRNALWRACRTDEKRF